MHSLFRYILLLSIVLFSSLRMAAQLAMPDNVCKGAVKHYYVDPNPVPGSTYTWKIDGIIQPSSTTNEIDISWNNPGTYLLEVQELSLDGCYGLLRSGQVVVNPLPVPVISGPANACAGIAGNVYTTATGMTNYIWSVSAGGTITAGGGTGSNIVTVKWTTTGAQTVSVNYGNANGCTAASPTIFNVTVTPVNTISLSSVAGTDTQTTCINMAITNITYATTGATGATVTGLPAGVTAAWASNTITISGTPTASGVFNYSIPLTGGCGVVTKTGTITVNALPVTSNISGSLTPACNGIGVIYNVTLTPGSSYLWTVPAGSSITSGATGPNNNQITVNFGTTNGNISVTETNSLSCVGTPKTLAVSLAGCNLNADFKGSSLTICMGSGVIFTSISTGTSGSTTYYWNFGSGASPATANTIGPHTVTYSTSGLKTITLVLTDGVSDTEIKSDYLTVTPNVAIAVFTPATSARCQGSGTVIYTTTATNSTGITYSLDPASLAGGNTIVATTGAVTYSPTWSGTTTITATATGCNGPATTTHVVTVNALPVPAITGSSSVCAASTGNVYSTTAGMTNYAWAISAGGTITAGGTSTSNTVTVTWNTSGAQTVSINYTNSNSCTASTATTKSITVNPLPVPTITGPTPVCQNSTGNVYTTEAGMTGYTWTISAGGTITAGSGTNSITVTWNTAGARTVSVNYTNANSCTAASPTVYNVTVNALPTPTITGPAAACVNSTGNVYTTQAGMTNYVWTVSTGGTITAGGGTGNNMVIVTWTTAGARTVSVSYNNTNNCTAGSPTVYNVTVNALPVPVITGSATVCAGSTSNVYSTTAGMTNYAWLVSAGGTITAGGTSTSNTVTVTWNTSGAQTVSVNYTNANSCTAASPTVYNVTVNALPTITGTTPASRCGTGTVVLAATASAGTINWYSTFTGGTSDGTGPTFITPSITSTKTYYVDATNNSCTSTPRTPVVATVILVPSAAGSITGPATYTPGTNGIPYSVAAIPEATSYIWAYTGNGVTIHGTGTNVTLDFSSSATGGQLTVKGHNSCYDGLESTLGLSPNPKTLNITVFLEGLYNGSGGMVKVQGCTDGENSFDMFSGTISDTLTVQIAQINDPYLILYTVHGVPINTDGTINLNAIPGTFTNSYYIIIKHRNHIETWSQIVSFTGQIISYNFTDAVSKAWGNNMIKIGSKYCIYTGDTNKDQYVDGFDIVITFNLNKLGSFGYQVSDINGDGFVDGFDLVKVFNNNKKGVGMITPAAPMKKKK